MQTDWDLKCVRQSIIVNDGAREGEGAVEGPGRTRGEGSFHST